jgi:hypothetical protein
LRQAVRGGMTVQIRIAKPIRVLKHFDTSAKPTVAKLRRCDMELS